jgi:DNA-binding transcriptional ArsR family regulator
MSALATSRDLKSHFIGLANPTRLAIVALLTRGDLTASEVARRLKLSQPLLSWHLRVMRKAGLIRTARLGRELQLSLDRKAIRDYQKRFNEFISESPHPAADADAVNVEDDSSRTETPEVKETANAI